ncbi:MAG: CDP-alcohol phosphatidyltransferase family protein [Alphaproteobacteria bacterium]|nr:CDP-alcohol phosphatidyltransferase family protein [Alphaproteobacteria bacterium]
MSLPNLISIVRLLLVPLIVSLMLGRDYELAFALFVVAGLSDAIDGYIANRFNMRTELGAYLDPIADKALLVCVYVTLGVQGELAQVVVTLVVSRDLLIVGAVILSYLVGHPLKIAPLMLSKLNTAAQIVLAAMMLAALGFLPALEPALVPGQWIVAATTLLSGLAYFLAWFASITAWDIAQRPPGGPQ